MSPRLAGLVALCLLPACVYDEGLRPHRFVTMTLVPDDFASDVRARPPASAPQLRDVLALSYWGSIEDDETLARLDAYFTARIAVVSLATGERVAGRVERGVRRTRGERVVEHTLFEGGYSFVSDVDLTDGWYVLVVDARDLGVAMDDLGLPIGIDQGGAGLHVRRVHVGPRPTWVLTSVGCDDGRSSSSGRGRCSPSVTFSEPVVAGTEGRWSLSRDGVDAACGDLVIDGRYGFWSCPAAPDGTSWRVSHLEPGEISELDASTPAQTIVAGGNLEVSVAVSPEFGIAEALAAL